jgi:hypothetical protein
MAEFDLIDVVRLSSLRLASAGIVPPEDRGKEQAEQQLKIQLLFYGRRVEKNGDEIIVQSEIKKLHHLLGDKILIKFKVGEEVFKHCKELGMIPGSECDWDAVPQVWFYKEKNENSKNGGIPKNGIWYKPAALLKLDGKDISYQILQVAKSKRPAMQDAFSYFNSTASATGWDTSLDNLENQINSELSGVG